jgi:hypothetical protein
MALGVADREDLALVDARTVAVLQDAGDAAHRDWSRATPRTRVAGAAFAELDHEQPARLAFEPFVELVRDARKHLVHRVRERDALGVEPGIRERGA